MTNINRLLIKKKLDILKPKTETKVKKKTNGIKRTKINKIYTEFSPNIITNSCLGGWLYRKYNLPFNNPFVWCYIDFNSMINLITNYKTLNYENVKISKTKFGNCDDIYSVLIDNKVKVIYSHYHETRAQASQYAGINIFRSDIKDYVAKKYFSRIKRIASAKDPIFIVHGGKNEAPKYDYTTENLKKLIGMKFDYKVIIITNDKELESINDDENKIVIYDPKINYTYEHQGFIANTHYDFLKTLFK